MNDIGKKITDALQYRFACKKYDKNKQVSDADFHTILEAARLSPSSFGYEPWRFLVIERQDVKDDLYPIAWGARNSLEGASHLVVILARKAVDMNYASPYITHIMKDIQQFPDDIGAARRKGFENFQKNDFKLLESDRAMFDWACKQTYIALADMLMTAALLGVDACPIEGFDREKVEAMLAEKGVLDREHFGVSVMVSFGYRSGDHRPKTRQQQDDVVQWIR